jgi:tripartite-type tricarboxylate transporter receptor subunit TctC
MLEMFASFAAHNLAPADFPSQAVTMVVPFSLGSVDDLDVRRIVARAEQATTQRLCIENHPGHDGGDARRLVERSRPDGHTVLLLRDDHRPSRFRVSGSWCTPWNAVFHLQRLIDDACRELA